jgi:hypothetical protein
MSLRPALIVTPKNDGNGKPDPVVERVLKRGKEIIELPSEKSWIQLVYGLRHAAEISRAEKPVTGQPGLRSAWLAMDYIWEFLCQQRAFLEDPQAIAPVARLRGALGDLPSGHVDPMLKVQKRAGDTSNLAIVKGLAARALGELILSGVPIDEAAPRVAKACGALGGRKVADKEVKNWRYRFRGKPGPGAPKGGPGRFAYERPMLEETPGQRADVLLKELREIDIT